MFNPAEERKIIGVETLFPARDTVKSQRERWLIIYSKTNKMETLKNKTNTRLKLKKVELSTAAKSVGGGCFREGPNYVCCYQGDTWYCMGRPPAV